MITWTIDEKEADYILNAVALRPYSECHQLIAKLVAQANESKVPPLPEVPNE